jgi:hypothetical protein
VNNPVFGKWFLLLKSSKLAVFQGCFPMKKGSLFLLLAFSALSLSAQETITLLNGKVISASRVKIDDFSISYSKDTAGGFRRIDNYRVFSVTKSDGSETVVYRKDSEDSLDFTPEQMRLFIQGEQEADRYFKGYFNQGVGFSLGAVVAAPLGLSFGLFLVPPIYSTVVGSFSPNMKRAKVSDPSLRQIQEFSEGYQKKVRDKKIRQSFVAGMIGFAMGFTYHAIARK